MLEIDRDESQQIEEKGGDMGSRQLSGLGALLKAEREKRGLSHDQVVEITRLRRHFIEALENEDWNNLPSSVFVRGFIRSYARTLNLDEEKVFDLYESIATDETVPLKPLIEPSITKRGWLVLLILIVGVMAAIIYLWKGYLLPEQAFRLLNKESPSESQEKSPAIKSEEAEPAVEQDAGPIDPELSALLEEIYRPVDLMIGEKLAEYLTDETSYTEPTTKPADTSGSTGSVGSAATTADPDDTAGWLILNGTVTGKTWIKIYIDDQEPKEYIFHPGSMPQWKAREGFNILIGNAAGIEFDFNGKRIGNLGNIGQVVKLSLPEDFEVTGSED